MKTTTHKPRELTASEITAYALKVLDLRGVECWRNNNLAVKGRKFIGRKGVADIMGFVRESGLLCACEVKAGKDRLSDEQIEFLNQVAKAGSFAFVAKQVGSEIVIEKWQLEEVESKQFKK